MPTRTAVFRCPRSSTVPSMPTGLMLWSDCLQWLLKPLNRRSNDTRPQCPKPPFENAWSRKNSVLSLKNSDQSKKKTCEISCLWLCSVEQTLKRHKKSIFFCFSGKKVLTKPLFVILFVLVLKGLSPPSELPLRRC